MELAGDCIVAISTKVVKEKRVWRKSFNLFGSCPGRSVFMKWKGCQVKFFFDN